MSNEQFDISQQNVKHANAEILERERERVHMFWKTGMTSSPPQMHVVISRRVMSDLILSTTMCVLWSTQVLCCHFWPASLWATENWVTSFIHNRGVMSWHSTTRLICISLSDAPSPSSVWLKVLSGLLRKIKSGSLLMCVTFKIMPMLC